MFGRLVEFLNRPDSAGVVYRLGHTKPESVMVEIALPGWHTIARADAMRSRYSTTDDTDG